MVHFEFAMIRRYKVLIIILNTEFEILFSFLSGNKKIKNYINLLAEWVIPIFIRGYSNTRAEIEFQLDINEMNIRW